MKRIFALTLAACLTLTMIPGAVMAKDAADTIYVNGKIVTVDANFSIKEAVAVKDGRIIAVGSDSEVKKLSDSGTNVVDLGGKTVLPGLIDNHLHFQRYGLKFIQINCTDKTKETILSEVAGKVTDLNDTSLWIRGNGWNQELWSNPVFPTASDLDKYSPENPVALIRSDNHALWVNSKALEIAGITKDTKDPDGGVIRRDANGNPTGILVDNAMNLVNEKMPAWSEAEVKMAYLAADKSYSSLGITTVGDAGDSIDIPILKGMYAADEINTRTYAVLDKTTADKRIAAGEKPEYDLFDYKLSIGAIKLKADGALGSRGAKMMADYSDEPGTTGNTLISKEELIEYTKHAEKLGYQLHIHAIGDKTNRDALDAIEYSIKNGDNAGNKRRHSIVHAQILALSDIPRFGELNVPAIMQPIHATGDMSMAETRVGSWRILGAYAWRSLIDQGTIVTGGSDSPNDYVEPLYGIHAFVTRQNRDSLPTGGWYSQQNLTVKEAIEAYTINAAYSCFQENIKGSIEVGKLADFIVLDKDILTIPKEDIHTINIVKTIVGDKEVYSK